MVVAHPPRFGAKAAAVDDSAARKVRGVVDVKTIPQGVAVYANGFWAAKKARDALKIAWDESGSGDARHAISCSPTIAASRSSRARRRRTAAMSPSALDKATRKLQAEYVFPYLAHAPMEPLDCAIELNEGACEAWFGAQLQTVDHKTIATVMGLPEEKVEHQHACSPAAASAGARNRPAISRPKRRPR